MMCGSTFCLVRASCDIKTSAGVEESMTLFWDDLILCFIDLL